MPNTTAFESDYLYRFSTFLRKTKSLRLKSFFFLLHVYNLSVTTYASVLLNKLIYRKKTIETN